MGGGGDEEKQKKKRITSFIQNILGSIRPFPEPIQYLQGIIKEQKRLTGSGLDL